MATRERGAFPGGSGMARGRRRGRLPALLGGLGLAVAAAGPVAAQPAAGLYDTGRVLPYLGKECGGMPGCVTVDSRRHRVAAGRSAVIRARCPTNHPYLVGWDTEQHEHLAAHALPPQTAGSGAERSDAAAEAVGGIRVGVANNGGAAGHITVFIGCSAEAPRATAVLRHRSGVPSNLNTFRGGSQ